MTPLPQSQTAVGLMGRIDLGALIAQERAELEHRLVDFDVRWHAEALVPAVRALSPTRWRWAAIVEMVKVDLERHWRCGIRRDLCDYPDAVPELGPSEVWPADLIHTDFQLRAEFGPPENLDRYLAQYPVQAAAVRALVREGAAATRPRNKPAATTAQVGGMRDAAKFMPPALKSGDTFGRYRVIRLLGRGGMGSVYLAHDPQLQRAVALKLPSEELLDDPRATEFVLREARAAAGLHHPNICPVYDVGDIGGVPFITSRYIEGEPLSAVARRTPPVAEQEAVRLVALIARALAFAHRNGVIHRDIKPANVMLEANGQPIVMDFGLARHVAPGGTAHATLSGGLVGSPAYMAPEQVGERRAGEASDVYSLGVLLYELLTGRVPFLGSIEEVLEQVVMAEAPPPSRFRPGLDPRLEAVCLRALARSRHERYRSMAEFAAALEPLARRPRSNRTRWVVAAVVALAACSAGLLVWHPWRPNGVADAGSGTQAVVRTKPEEYVPAYRRAKGFDATDLKLQKAPPKFERPTDVAGWVAGLEKWKDAETGPDQRLIAIEALAKLGDREAILALAAKMRGDYPKTHWSERRECAAAIAHLGWDGDPRAVKALSDRVADHWWLLEVHNAAHQWRNPFGSFYQDPEHGGKGAALEGLVAIAPEQVEDALLRALQQTKRPPEEPAPRRCGEPYLVRAWAAQHLGDYKSPRTALALTVALKDENGLVRKRAAESLTKLKDASASDALAKRVSDDKWLNEFTSLLGEANGRTYADPEWGGKADALAALKAVAGRERVLAALRDAERSSNAKVQQWARDELAK